MIHTTIDSRERDTTMHMSLGTCSVTGELESVTEIDKLTEVRIRIHSGGRAVGLSHLIIKLYSSINRHHTHLG